MYFSTRWVYIHSKLTAGVPNQTKGNKRILLKKYVPSRGVWQTLQQYRLYVYIFNPKSSVMRVILQILDTYTIFYPKIKYIHNAQNDDFLCYVLLCAEKYKPNTRKLHKYSIRRLANVFITFSYQKFFESNLKKNLIKDLNFNITQK